MSVGTYYCKRISYYQGPFFFFFFISRIIVIYSLKNENYYTLVIATLLKNPHKLNTSLRSSSKRAQISALHHIKRNYLQITSQLNPSIIKFQPPQQRRYTIAKADTGQQIQITQNHRSQHTIQLLNDNLQNLSFFLPPLHNYQRIIMTL